MKMLRSVSLPDTLVSVESCAFASCLSLTLADLPAGVRRVGNDLPDDCISLKDGSSIKNDQQKRQIDLALNNRGNYINKNEIAQYLTLSIGSAHELWCVRRLFLCWGCNSPLNT